MSALTIEQAYRHCAAQAAAHDENFPTASRLLAPAVRSAVAAIYAFAREADDIADEGDASPEERLARLDAWEMLLDRCAQEELTHPVFLALGDAIHRFSLPIEPLRDLLVAFRMDVTVHAYASEEELYFYARHSAAPIGRLLLHLHRAATPEALAASDALCIALQWVNLWQDLADDLTRRGRCYLPATWLAEGGLTPQRMLAGPIDDEALQPVWAVALARTEALFDDAAPLPRRVPRRLAMQAAASIAGGRAILARLRRRRSAAERPRLSAADKARMALAALGAAIRR